MFVDLDLRSPAQFKYIYIKKSQFKDMKMIFLRRTLEISRKEKLRNEVIK